MKFIINANYGSFDNIQKAANSEKLINWWDDRDERQIYCTECFAALEIIEHLKSANLKYIGDKSELEKLIIGDMSENLRILDCREWRCGK